jgi:hypothetical protein
MTDQARRDSLYDSANRKRYAGARAEATARAARLMLAPTASGIGVAGQF